jgi:hypothetical protein
MKKILLLSLLFVSLAVHATVYSPKGFYKKSIGSVGTPITTFSVGTGLLLDYWTKFLPINVRIEINDSVTNETEWIDLNPTNKLVYDYWDFNGSWAVACNAIHYYTIHNFCSLNVQSGALMDTGTTYNSLDIWNVGGNKFIDVIIFDMIMYG